MLGYYRRVQRLAAQEEAVARLMEMPGIGPLNGTALLASLGDRRGLGNLAAATVLGPYVSVYLSILALRHAEAGVAQVLLGAVPIFVMGPAWLAYRDRPSPLALVGVVVAVAGGALLFLR